MSPFHWIAEFPEVAAEDVNGNGHDVQFDIVVGNPPYGDIMGDSEKILTDGFTTADINDISAMFVERQLRLLDENGTLGNIRTLRLVYQSSLQDLHDFIRDRFDQMEIACFAHRPQQVFPNAIVRVAIMTGQQTHPDGSGSIRTSKFLQFKKENRKEVFDSIEYRPVEWLELREYIGGNDRSYEVLPKVGVQEIERLLETLRDSTKGAQTVSGLQSGIEKCRNQFDEEVRGIIVAPSVSEKAEAMIQITDIKHVNLYSVVNPST